MRVPERLPAPTVPRLYGINFDKWISTGEIKENIPSRQDAVDVVPPLKGYALAYSKRYATMGLGTKPFSLETYTWEAWVKPDAGQQALMMWTVNNGDTLMQLETSSFEMNGTRYMTVYTGGYWKVVNANNLELLDGNWHHFAVVFELIGSQYHVRVYVDGIHRKYDRNTGTGSFLDGEIVFNAYAEGSKHRSLDCPFDGKALMSEFAIWRGIPDYIGQGKPSRGPLGYGV